MKWPRDLLREITVREEERERALDANQCEFDLKPRRSATISLYTFANCTAGVHVRDCNAVTERLVAERIILEVPYENSAF